MRKRACLITLGAIAVVSITIWLAWPAPEPSHNGHTLSFWIEACIDGRTGLIRHKPDPNAIEAISRIGTNALPSLFARLHYKPNHVRRAISSVLDHTPSRLRELLPGRLLHWAATDDDENRMNGAAFAFSVLGPRARPAIPMLLTMMKDPKSKDTPFAMNALANIGPDALPYLIEALQDTNAANRRRAAFFIGYSPNLRTNASRAVPALTACLRDQDPDLQDYALETLRKVSLQPDLVIPAIVDVAQTTTNAMLRPRLLAALGEFGPKARAATDCVLAALSDPDGQVRNAATNALLRIAPELLTNAPPP